MTCRNADRALPQARDAPYRTLFNTHKIFVVDNFFFTASSMRSIQSLFDNLPAHLMAEGVRKDAQYATLTVADAWKCNGQDPGLRQHTPRGFNVFKVQAGESKENGFGGTSFPHSSDLSMTVVGHEAAHQFDRLVKADAKLSAEYDRIRGACSTDADWLRSSVGNAFFAKSPQEIIASQVGNQYMRSSLNQLRLAVSRLREKNENDKNSAGTVGGGGSALPLAWFLFFLELFSNGKDPSSSTMYAFDTDVGMTTPLTTNITRNS